MNFFYERDNNGDNDDPHLKKICEMKKQNKKTSKTIN